MSGRSCNEIGLSRRVNYPGVKGCHLIKIFRVSRSVLIRYVLACLLFAVDHLVSNGQPKFHYIEKLTVKDGLSSNVVTDICRDSQGFIWVATRHGLNRYDGTEVSRYFSGKGPGKLADNILHRILPADSFHLAIATNYGLSVLNTRDNTFRSAFIPSDTLRNVNDNQFFLMEKDARGNFWLGSSTAIYRMDSDFHLKMKFRSSYQLRDVKDKRLRYVYKIIPLAGGEVLFWLGSGVHLWHPGSDTLIRIRKKPEGKWSFLQGSSFFQSFDISKQYLVFADYATDSLWVIDEQTGERVSCRLSPKKENQRRIVREASGLGNGWIAVSFERKGSMLLKVSRENQRLSLTCYDSIFLPEIAAGKWLSDREGNKWITTSSEGLVKISPNKQRFTQKTLNGKPAGGPSGFETESFLKRGDQLFISTYGNGFYAWNPVSGEISHYSARYGPHSENMVWNIRQHRGDTLWLGTQQGLLWYDLADKTMGRLGQTHPSVLDSFAITTQFTDSKGLVWIGIGRGHGLCVYDTRTNVFKTFSYRSGAYPYRYPMAIGEDKNSNIWFISDATAQLVEWIRDENRFVKKDLSLFKGKILVQTNGFFLDKEKGLLWYGVESAGLVCYNIYTGDTKTYGMENGLSTDLIFSIQEDREGILWLSTAQGISSFDPSRGRFVNYRNIDGLPATYFSANMYYDSSIDRMYAGAPDRVVYFSPAAFHQRRRPMTVRLTGIQINGQPVSLPVNRRLRLSWRLNDVAISFTGINFVNGDENQYSYKIKDNDTSWTDIGAQRQIRFANLNPGHYTFTVRGARRGENWSPVTDQIHLLIRPPFYRTIWFYLLCLAAIGGMIYFWYRYKLAQLLRLEEMRSRISHNLHDDIGSRLTNISMMSRIAMQKGGSGESKDEWLQRIGWESENISQSMREIIWNINPSNDSMEEAMPRMLRFASEMLEPGKIEVEASVTDLGDLKIDMEKRRDLFLIFKESIHNVTRHSEAKKVWISTKIKDGAFLLQLADDGKGFKMEQLAYRNGLQYMQQRAEKNHWDLMITSKPGRGTTIRLEIKLK